MFLVCLVATVALCFLVDQTFRNDYLTIGLCVVMGLTSGFLTAVDKRRKDNE